jgi:hypothetical protein
MSLQQNVDNRTEMHCHMGFSLPVLGFKRRVDLQSGGPPDASTCMSLAPMSCEYIPVTICFGEKYNAAQQSYGKPAPNRFCNASLL